MITPTLHGAVLEINEIMHVKHLVWCLEHVEDVSYVCSICHVKQWYFDDFVLIILCISFPSHETRVMLFCIRYIVITMGLKNFLSSAKENTDPKIASPLSFYYHDCQGNLDLEPHYLVSTGLFSCCLYSGRMHYHHDRPGIHTILTLPPLGY